MCLGGGGGHRKCCSQFINIRVEDTVHEANAGALVGVLVGQLDVNLPETTLEWGYIYSQYRYYELFVPDILSSGPLNLT